MESKKTRELDNGIIVLDVGYRRDTPVALVIKKYEKYDDEHIIAFNYKIQDNKIDWGYAYYYGTNENKAKNDFKEVLAGKTLENTFATMNFIDDEEKMRDFYRLSKDDFLSSYSYLTEQEYEQTKKYVLENRNHYVSRVKECLLEEKNIMSLPVRYFENNKWDKKNIFIYLAEKYNIQIPDKEKEYISKNLVFYLVKDKKFTAMTKGKEMLNIIPYLEQIKEKVNEEDKRQKRKKYERSR